MPGVEPGTPGWKPGILAVRPRETVMTQSFEVPCICEVIHGIHVIKKEKLFQRRELNPGLLGESQVS